MPAAPMPRRRTPETRPVAAANVAISVNRVSKVFGRGDAQIHALNSVNVDVGSSEFVSIVGPSGCGKSTLLRIMAGLSQPTSGEVVTNGHRVKKPATDIGIVFQNPVLLDWRNVIDNVLIQIELRGDKPGKYRERARLLLDAVGLGEFLARYPRELSGGMRQRAAIIRALIHEPPVLLMDEPFGALDALTREQMRVDLELLWMRTQKTVVFVTHGIDEAVLLADRVVVMSPRPGQIEEIIDVTIPRPRGLDARHHPQFVKTTQYITELFLSRGVLRANSRLSEI
jgi:NitT/TauT family transport system ATP-binding protein